MATGVNQIDTMTGYLGFNNGGPDGHRPDQGRPRTSSSTVPGSLLGKARWRRRCSTASSCCRSRRSAPEFFLVPGDNQVTVLWQPLGHRDDARSVLPGGQPADTIGRQSPNPLYDPNFRGNDVEGYRIYRGRVDNPTELQLIAQFDYAPDPATGKGIFKDFRALVNPTAPARPSSGVTTRLRGDRLLHAGAGQPVRRQRGHRSGRHHHPGHPGQPRAARGRQGADPAGHSWTPRSRTSRGRVAQGVSTDLSNNGVPFIFVDHERPEQPAVLLLGHRVRRELAGLGSLEPRVQPGHEGGDAGAGGVELSRSRPTS